MVQYVTITVDTSALFVPATRAYGNVGIVGYGISGSTALAKQFTKQSDVETEYGANSAIAKSALLAFQNGARVIWCIRATESAGTQQSIGPGDGVETEFSMTSTTNQPQQGSVVVEVNSVEQVEGTDYTMDYGNCVVIFNNPPANGATITIDFDYITAANIQTALALLENRDINIVVGAVIYCGSLLEKIKDHVVSASSGGHERIGVAMLRHGDTSGDDINSVTVVGTGGKLTNNERMVCYGSCSYQDVASACAGLIGGNRPWISMLLKALSGITQSKYFTDTEIDALNALQVNWIWDPDLITGTGLYTGEGYTLASDSSKLYIDIVRVIDDIVFRLKTTLMNPQVIGTLKITSEGLRALRSKIRATLNGRRKAGEIVSFDVVVPLLQLVVIPVADRTEEETSEIQAARAIRTVDVDVSIEYSGAIHRLDVNLKFI